MRKIWTFIFSVREVYCVKVRENVPEIRYLTAVKIMTAT